MVTPQFFHAGRAVFTIENGRGDHYTFKVNRAELSGKAVSDQPMFIQVMTHGAGGYTYMGILDRNNTCRVTRKSSFTDQSTAVRVFNFASAIIHGVRPLPQGYQIHHEGACGKCGRPLTDPISIITGLGPVCRGERR